MSSFPSTMACSGSSYASWTLGRSSSLRWSPSSCRPQRRHHTPCSAGGSLSRVRSVINTLFYSENIKTYKTCVEMQSSISGFSGKHAAQWGLDNVLIGMNDSARSGFFDTFDGTSPLRHNWYRVVGGEVTADCLSRDSVLNFNSELMDSE